MFHRTVTRISLSVLVFVTLTLTPLSSVRAISPSLKDVEQSLQYLQAQIDTLVTKKVAKTKQTQAQSTSQNIYVVDGRMVTPTYLDTITTRSGAWKFSDLGAVGDSRAYLWQLEGRDSFARIMVCRRIFTKEAGDTAALSMQTIPVQFTIQGTVHNWTLGVAQGSCRIAQTEDPVAPNAAWLREAVAANRVPAYVRERAWMPKLFKPLTPDAKRGTYDTQSLGPIPGSAAAPHSGSNYIGVTSAQGGEYTSSRGFLHDADARVIDAALHNEDSRIQDVWSQFTQYTLYSLAQPQGAMWSQINHVTGDPQFPLSGDRPYEIPVWTNPKTDIDSMADVTNWGRDLAHLENTGYIHWLLTEDPVAGLVVQRQGAYALAGLIENYRTVGGKAYVTSLGQERAVFNVLSALWKSRDVSLKVSSVNGKVFWDKSRVERQANESIASLEVEAQKIAAAQASDPSRYTLKLTGTLFGYPGIESYPLANGTSTDLFQVSDFMLPQYGKEPLWLWTKSGNASVRSWLTTYARSMTVRLHHVGGSMGVDKSSGSRGSGFPIGPTARDSKGRVIVAVPPFTDDVGWASWVANLGLADQATNASRDTFNKASIHTAMQSEALLLFAKDLNLPVADLDTALASVASAKEKTTVLTYPDLQMVKHMSAPTPNITPAPIGTKPSTSTPPTPTPTPTPTLTLSTTTTSLTWSATNATACTASNGWTGNKSTSGTQAVIITATTTYTLTCTGTGGSVAKTVTIAPAPKIQTPPVIVPPVTPIITLPTSTPRYQTTEVLRVRGTPSVNGTSLGTQPKGAQGTRIGAPVTADNVTWYNMNYEQGVDGWSASTYLTPVTTGTTPKPQVSPSPTTPTLTCTPEHSIGDTIQTNARRTKIYSRPNGKSISTRSRNATATITATTCVGTITWYKLDFKKGKDGYVQERRVR